MSLYTRIFHFFQPSNGGVVMVNFYSCYVAPDCSASVEDVVKHVQWVRKTAGVDHVGIGGDYNGIDT